MFCCASPSIRKLFWLPYDHHRYDKIRNEQKLCIVYDHELFRKKKNYLPKLREHKIQEEPNFVIDDPSSIFFDPDEKSGFVYTSHNCSQYDLELDNVSEAGIHGRKQSKVNNASLDSSLDLDDSLDLISNLPITPTLKKDASFDNEFEMQSRRESYEPEQIDSCDEADYQNYHVNMIKTPVNLMLSSDKNVSADLGSMRLYEDSGYGSGGQRQRKDYNSDAESTNKYQDSGIYEDEVFSDSPKHSSGMKMDSESFIHDVEFEMDDFLPEHSERHSAFKTPSSSPLKLEPVIPLSKINGKQEKPKGRLSRFLQQEREDVPIISSCIDYLSNEKQADVSILLNDRITKPVVRKSSAKYSHVQAKVQTRRTNSISPRRSSSPSEKIATQANRKTPNSTYARQKSSEPAYKPMHFGRPKIENIKPEFRKKAKPKVGSLENVAHAPGGGQTKVFKQKLNFRKNAESRTDTHGVEMYSHLPQEFQEIARRLSRQDHQLKLNGKQSQRGRVASRSSSTVASSRASSISPTRGRTKTRNRPPTPSLPLQKTTYRATSPNHQVCLSRSPSIRSIPTTPVLHNKHPATSSVLYDKKCRSRNGSPSSSRAHSPSNIVSNCSSRASSPTGNRSRSRSKSRSRPTTPKNGDSQPTTPIRQLYQFTQANTFIPGSPKTSGTQPVFHFVPVR